MSLLVTGSIGIDTVETPDGKAENILGGSSVYFSYAASFFSPVRLVGAVGEDCPADFLKPLADNENIDMSGLEVREGSKTFRWHGKYHEDVNQRDTISVDLNILAEQAPVIPEQFADSEYIFLANTAPALQREFIKQCKNPKLIVADTMDLWIETARGELVELMKEIDGIVLNDSEAQQFTGKNNVIEAGHEIAGMVKKFCVVKKGQHGACLFTEGKVYPLPSYPSTKVVDPTGAGDCFAGGFMGHIAASDKTDTKTLRRAVAMGTMVASIELEDFSLNKLTQISKDEIYERLDEFSEMTQF